MKKKKLEKVTASNFSEIMKEEATKSAGRTKKESPVMSTEDQENINRKIEGKK